MGIFNDNIHNPHSPVQLKDRLVQKVPQVLVLNLLGMEISMLRENV